MRYGQIKNKQVIEIVNALTIVKTQFKDLFCSEFFCQIAKEKVFLHQVNKSDKYQLNVGRLLQRETYILFLHEFF
jgi:hypothetical protein